MSKIVVTPKNRRWKSSEVSHKWTLDEAIKVPTEQILHMDIKERAELAYFLQNKLRLRRNQFRKSDIVPYALEKLDKDFKQMPFFDFNEPIIKTRGRFRNLNEQYSKLSNPQNRLMAYINMVQDYFNSKSSTVAGYRDIIYEESARLFGYVPDTSRKRGYGPFVKLRHLMTPEERGKFWDLFHELEKSGKTMIYSSEQIMESGFTKIWLENDWDFNDPTAMFNKMITAVNAYNSTPEYEEHAPGDASDPLAHIDALSVAGDDLTVKQDNVWRFDD